MCCCQKNQQKEGGKRIQQIHSSLDHSLTKQRFLIGLLAARPLSFTEYIASGCIFGQLGSGIAGCLPCWNDSVTAWLAARIRGRIRDKAEICEPFRKQPFSWLEADVLSIRLLPAR